VNFRGHLLGGIAAGAGVCATAVFTGQVVLERSGIDRLAHQVLNRDSGWLMLAGLFLITLAMALFPDLDGASIPQRWFYRGVFVCLVFLLAMRRMDLFAALTLIALTPLLHRHRGWTHSPLTPFVIACVVVMIIAYQPSQPGWWRSFSADSVLSALRDGWIYLLACVLGHYTHLLLDSR
jgi:membrane-bound metal-dependent hydrolase YbcI (DUF457 family)